MIIHACTRRHPTLSHQLLSISAFASHPLFPDALAAEQVGKQVADEGERAFVSRRCVKAPPFGRYAALTRWALRRVFMTKEVWSSAGRTTAIRRALSPRDTPTRWSLETDAGRDAPSIDLGALQPAP